MLGGTYGRTVNVIAGKGNNGADGRSPPAPARSAGVRVRCLRRRRLPAGLPAADLVIDAAYGTGFHGDVARAAMSATRRCSPSTSRAASTG